MAIIAYTLPIVPGQTDSALDFAAELTESGFADRYAELNRRAKLRWHREWLQSSPAGEILVVAFETPAPELLAREFDAADPYDNWWRARVKWKHGFDPATGGALPQLTDEWLTEN